MAMTLKEVCLLMRKYEYDSDACEHFKNEFLVENHNNFKYEELEESDISNLRPYIQCTLLSFYECIAEITGNELPEWFNRYDGAYCKKEENDYYLELVELGRLLYGSSGDMNASRCFDLALESAIEPFKKRGICRTCLDDTV